MKKLFLMVMAVWAGLAGTAAAQNLLSPAEATVYEGDKLADEAHGAGLPTRVRCIMRMQAVR